MSKNKKNTPLSSESNKVEYHEFNPQFKEISDNIMADYKELLILDKILTQIKENKELFKKHNFTLEFSDGEETQQLI
ncbi:hypothetical protein SAMN06265371_106220 [Lutibacter agarilyticus]|uniref:Uncharacterized protein n=1 Tax=Lutibacter agarilyticus TaxID=1109740 RepID=A0A238XQ64_9FLAO|nr:hypothetical protein [Lutibacter agarilyticus]SNR60822.1 hypothetical protein SAMN06265371_106220 [Lutibacter agarilyticus]